MNASFSLSPSQRKKERKKERNARVELLCVLLQEILNSRPQTFMVRQLSRDSTVQFLLHSRDFRFLRVFIKDL